ncbi:MAG: pilin [Thiohalomonadales bacterium]
MNSSQHPQQSGFTLIELMIVVAIIGILAAIAIPAYQDYTKRAHVSEGLTLAASAKSAISEYFSTNGVWPTNNALAGLPSSITITGNAVDKISIVRSTITISYNTKVSNGSTVVLQASSSQNAINWFCTDGDVQPKYRPSRCR